ncbi:aspartic peptidase domain-containing protein [Mycena olivaceomarginata]|nr:aspartic peptidase domain-containing protein [Mycena olivaceomarginata]
MVGRLEFSDYDKETDSRYDMLFDLGSSPFWVISSDLESIFMGATEFGQGAHGLVKQDRNIRVNPGPFTSSYVDGSGVTYSTVRDVLRIPASEHLPANLRQPRWIHVIIGVANHAWGRIKEAPFSGIVGLGRQMASDKSHPPSFLSQIGPRLTRPELTIALTRHIGRISFGKRPNLSVTKELSWSKNIPVVDYYNLWVVSSPKKFIENVEIQSPGQLAMFDTGSVFSYLDDAVVRKIYDHIPEHKKDPTTNLFLVPTDLFGYPKVQLQLGDADDIFELGSFFDEFFEPNIATDTTTVYRAGSIQPKSVLPNYSGPDIIGLTALINMELNLQFPASDEGAHKVAWRHKEKNATGVKADWGPGVSSRRDVV